MPPDQPWAEPHGSSMAPEADDVWLQRWLDGAHRRWRVWHLVRCAIIGLGTALVMRAVLGPSATSLLTGAAGLVGVTVALLGTKGLRDIGVVVGRTELETPALRNALFTWYEGRGALSGSIAAHLARHARQALANTTPSHPVSRMAWGAALAIVAAGVASNVVAGRLPSGVPPSSAETRDGGHSGNAVVALDWHAVVTPPGYAARSVERAHRPPRIVALAGSRLDVTFTGWPSDAVARLGAEPIALSGSGVARDLRLTASDSDVLQVQGGDGKVMASIVLVVTPDVAPVVRVTAPAADLRRADARGTVPITVTARDDIGIRDLRLRFTKVSGSGESFTFEDGEWPVRVERRSPTEWTGTYTLDLATAGLGPGDSIAYHALAHDARVGPEGAGESERFLIEIARPGALTAGDFSLPEPEEKFALSQRMVIQLTERLLERRPRMTAEQFQQEAQVLAIAQRRVRAEFVFMLGGEVEDEFEEAAHSHEVEGGRLENKGQGDLIEAVRQMSLAETRLTAIEVREALPYEYKALAALQAAFGKARYFMRTLPSPVQIDANRRLQGDRSQAGSSRWAMAAIPDASRAAALELLGRLESPGTAVAPLLPQLVALDRQDAAWVAEVQRASSEDGAAGVARLLRARLLPGSTTWLPMPLPRTTNESALTSRGASTP